MNLQDIHELLRVELLRRIEAKTLTRTSLARQTGFRQAHISNFLNRKRSLSLEGLDRVLASQDLSVEQLLPVDIFAGSSQVQPDSDQIPVVTSSSAMDEGIIRVDSVIETIHVLPSRLQDHPLRASVKQAQWQRFVAIRADVQQSGPMEPIITAGALVVIDRHYVSLAPYRARHRTLYAIRCGGLLVLRYVEFIDGNLVLRPLSLDHSVQVLPLKAHQMPTDPIVGRVCLVVSEP